MLLQKIRIPKQTNNRDIHTYTRVHIHTYKNRILVNHEKDEILSFLRMWIALMNMLSEMSQAKHDKKMAGSYSYVELQKLVM